MFGAINRVMEESEKLKTEENGESEEITWSSGAGTDGLSLDCSVLDLKDSANAAAIAADPSFEVTGNSEKVLPFSCFLFTMQIFSDRENSSLNVVE